MVVFPLPEGPTMATGFPFWTENEIFLRMGWFLWYSKQT